MNLMARRRALMGKAIKPITNPECVYIPHMVIGGQDGSVVEWYPTGITEYLEVSPTDTIHYKNANVPSSDKYPVGQQNNIGYLIAYNNNKNKRDWWNCWGNGTDRTLNLANYVTARTAEYIRLNIYIDGLADSYCYNETTGQVYYAGINTPYYGKTNIND